MTDKNTLIFYFCHGRRKDTQTYQSCLSLNAYQYSLLSFHWQGFLYIFLL